MSIAMTVGRAAGMLWSCCHGAVAVTPAAAAAAVVVSPTVAVLETSRKCHRGPCLSKNQDADIAEDLESSWKEQRNNTMARIYDQHNLLFSCIEFSTFI